VDALRRRIRWRLLSLFSDDAVVDETVRRVKHTAGPPLLRELFERLPGKLATELLERSLSVRKLDYDRHDLRLVVSSQETVMRLKSVSKEPFTVEWIERAVRPGQVFYDVGANVGAYSLIAARGAGAHVYAFEPAGPNYHDLCRNIALNGCDEQISPLPIALWNETALVPFSHRVLQTGVAMHTMGAALADAEFRQPVLAYRLDDALATFGLPVPNHAKIDVDGPELKVLQGATRALQEREWRSILLEVDPRHPHNDEAIVSLLAGYGFRVEATFDRGAAPASRVFVRDG
jgi:FkbM family methyltransferase